MYQTTRNRVQDLQKISKMKVFRQITIVFLPIILSTHVTTISATESSSIKNSQIQIFDTVGALDSEWNENLKPPLSGTRKHHGNGGIDSNMASPDTYQTVLKSIQARTVRKRRILQEYSRIKREIVKQKLVSNVSPNSAKKTNTTTSSITAVSTPPFKVIRLVLLLPESNDYEFNRSIVAVAVEKALESLNASGKTTGFRIDLDYGDSQCSEIIGPIRAFEFFWQKLVDAFLGPVCDYSAAPVARYSAYWQVPVITAGALSHDFGVHKKTQYASLTRVGASHTGVATLLIKSIQRQGWKRFINVYNGSVDIFGIQRLCYLASSAFSHAASRSGLEAQPEFWDEPEKLLKTKVGTENAGESQMFSLNNEKDTLLEKKRKDGLKDAQSSNRGQEEESGADQKQDGWMTSGKQQVQNGRGRHKIGGNGRYLQRTTSRSGWTKSPSNQVTK
ncbi:Atrial natriuretic peptide clearance receptor [Plakobranchus ocellatus]|uniref:Atrial natriuretic peptide clearance receptor n=1 Tax=Plakobranchus ocellatus TaxID=259542 RepID=A0AAV4CR21_9GAST|nr:Atrial natriuretic peptide clearance receptor [Plakobranchus ocellatus]